MSTKNKKEKCVIGLDSSTTGIKGLVFNKKGKVVFKASESISLNSPRPNYYEQDSIEWWLSAAEVLNEITHSINPDSISAVSISNQRETFVPLDSKGNALRPAIVWLDERCKDEVKTFSRKIGQKRIHNITGKPPDYAPVVYRLAWMKKYERELYKKIDMICDVHTYLAWKLTGIFATSWASADPLGTFDLRKMEWSSEILNALKLNKNQFPQTVMPGKVIGYVSREASILTGLKEGTAVIAGGGDGQAAGLGANILSSKRAYLNLGTAVVLGVFGKNYKVSKSFRTMSSCTGRGFYYECSLRAGSFAVNWFIKNILNIDAAEYPLIYESLEKEALLVNAGSDGLLHLPYLCGAMNPYWDVNAKASFVGLTSSHGRGHLYRALLEGIAFEQLHALNAVEKSINANIAELVAIGGGSENKLWLQIFADVTGKKICIPSNKEASGLGAGIAAAVGAGWYNNFKNAAEMMTGKERIIFPNPAMHKLYMSQFKKYSRLYLAVKSFN